MAEDLTAFPTLDGVQLAALDTIGDRGTVAVGEALYREGDAAYDFFVVVAGQVDIVVGSGANEQVIAQHGPGRFLGELNLLTGLRGLRIRRVTEPGRSHRRSSRRPSSHHCHPTRASEHDPRRVHRPPLSAADRGRERDPVVGSRYSPETGRVREFLLRSRIPHEWLDPERDADVEDLLREFGVRANELPVVIATGSVLRRPTPGELSQFLGLTVDSLPGRCFDLVVVGGGPAGLAAAVYGASEGLSTLGLEPVAAGGQAAAAPGSRTTSASQPESPAPTSPNVHWCRPRSSEPR